MKLNNFVFAAAVASLAFAPVSLQAAAVSPVQTDRASAPVGNASELGEDGEIGPILIIIALAAAGMAALLLTEDDDDASIDVPISR